jgi:hypothetical protein
MTTLPQGKGGDKGRRKADKNLFPSRKRWEIKEVFIGAKRSL